MKRTIAKALTLAIVCVMLACPAAFAKDVGSYTVDDLLESGVLDADEMAAVQAAAEKVKANDDANATSVATSVTEFEPIAVYTGTGDDVIELPEGFERGLFRIECDSNRHFHVWALDANLKNIDLLANTSKGYHGTVTTETERRTFRYLEIGASDQWSITLYPIDAIRTIENGEEVTGADVVRIPTDSIKITIKNPDGGHFHVISIKNGKYDDLLVNTSQEYEGTVLNKGFDYLAVESSGTWSISW